MSMQSMSAAMLSQLENGDGVRGFRVTGPLEEEDANQIRSAVQALSEGWVADDIVIDLRESSRVDERALAAMTSAGHQAASLGHRVVVRAARPLRDVLDHVAFTGGAFVVVD